MSPRNIDLFVRAAHFLTMKGEGVGYVSDAAMAVHNGKILDVGSQNELAGMYTARKTLDFGDNLVLPGFVDAHVHLKLSLLRGLAQDVGNWMMDGLSPFSSTAPSDVYGLSVQLGLLEAVRAGTTTFSEFSSGLDVVGDIFSRVGIRGVLTAFIREAVHRRYRPGELYDYDPEQGRRSLDEAISTFDRWNGEAGGRLTVYFGPQGADFASRKLLLDAKEAAVRRGARLHMHVQQGDRETEQTMMRYGKRPIEWLSEINYLDEQLIAVHLTDADESEAQVVAESGASMVLCSGSIGIIDGIVPPARAFQGADGNVVMENDTVSGIDEETILSEIRRWSETLSVKSAPVFNQINGPNQRYMRDGKL